MSRRRSIVVLAIAAMALHARAEDDVDEYRLPHHLETMDDPPATGCPVAGSIGPLPAALLPSVQVNVAGGQNIPGDAANEPSIAIDPTNPSRIAIGWRQFDSAGSNFRQAGHAYSTDGGQTWTFPGVFTPGTFRSDPILDADASGNFYYYSLRSSFDCDMFTSSDGGASWSGPVSAYGGDKAWIALDRTQGIGRGNVYLAWSNQAACCGDSTFSRSVDGGATFSAPQQPPGNPIFGTLAVAADGTLYLCGIDPASGVFTVDRSANAQDPLQSPTFDLSRTVNLGGDACRAAA
ncbi:MAG: sialidase family protein [Acidobacteriota bacterium]